MSAGLLISLLLVIAGPNDDASKARAQALVKEANLLFDEDKHAPALLILEAAYREYPSPKILYNIANVCLAIGEPLRAAQAFTEFLDAGLPPSEQHARAKKALEELGTKLGTLVITTSKPGARITLDQKPLGSSPVPTEWVEPGEHRVQAELDEHLRFEVVVAVEAGKNVPVAIELVLEKPPAPPVALVAPVRAAETSDDSITDTWWFWTAVSVIVVGAAVGTVAAASSGGGFEREGELGVISTRDLEGF